MVVENIEILDSQVTILEGHTSEVFHSKFNFVTIRFLYVHGIPRTSISSHQGKFTLFNILLISLDPAILPLAYGLFPIRHQDLKTSTSNPSNSSILLQHSKNQRTLPLLIGILLATSWLLALTMVSLAFGTTKVNIYLGFVQLIDIYI